MRWMTTALMLTLILAAAAAAEESGPPPPSLQRTMGNAPEVTLEPAPAVKPVTENKPGPRPTKIGEHRRLAPTQLAKGKWAKGTKGSPPVWRLTLRSPGAAALRLHFRDFRAGEGKAWVHNGKAWFGPYTGAGLYDDGDFWSHVVPGERLTIEYTGDAKDAKGPPFKVLEVSHLITNPLD